MKMLAYAALSFGFIACLLAMFLGAVVTGDQQGIGAVAVSLGALGIVIISIALLWKST
jgi:hypothetical protein